MRQRRRDMFGEKKENKLKGNSQILLNKFK